MNVSLTINNGELVTPSISWETKLADLIMAAGFPPVAGRYSILDVTVLRRGKVVFTSDVDHLHALQTWGPQHNDTITVVVKELRPGTATGTARHQYRKERVDAAVGTLRGEQECDAAMTTMSELLKRTSACMQTLKLFEEDADCTVALRQYIEGLQHLLTESECAVLRGFFFTMPKRRDRAMLEISERLSLLEYGIERIQTSWDKIKAHAREVQHAE